MLALQFFERRQTNKRCDIRQSKQGWENVRLVMRSKTINELSALYYSLLTPIENTHQSSRLEAAGPDNNFCCCFTVCCWLHNFILRDSRLRTVFFHIKLVNLSSYIQLKLSIIFNWSSMFASGLTFYANFLPLIANCKTTHVSVKQWRWSSFN